MSIRISGDMLALDASIRSIIEQQAERLAARFPDRKIRTEARILEEFDPVRGHRVRCELRIDLPNRRQMVVREARRDAAEAVAAAFAAAKPQLRRLNRPTLAEPTDKPAGTLHAVGGIRH
ncbi:Sigma 54 modulation protein / S30EA ribosomal protein [Thioflavicoccus mobilis 8321]|uniref:Sigma 54 modulation protein / S30EA ribosomal protein n=1 Tax=Thioflavicoccus mobilis 8321 TaxID=765912 RepID=L0GYJ9_9GAMM|nr:HPF/RaiA family ribosome-associated protein [Thioflavicoccus mobilis]AGA90389.1 Sigma 54 modulation protein / S30EA ribosomal protein [Thioflavicoccus mobilis 8321]